MENQISHDSKLAREMSMAGRARDRIICRLAFATALILGAVAFVVSVSGAPMDNAGDNGGSGDRDACLSPYFQVKGAEQGVDALPLKSTHVEAVLGGVIAEVRVMQTYQNEGKTPLEARYIFPGSTRAAVHGMTMTIGDRRIEAQIKEKEEARKTYENAKREGKTASLLESHRSNVFEMNVANILPGDTVTVELRYNELITPDDGQYEWVFPTVVGPRYTRAGIKSADEIAREKREADPLLGSKSTARMCGEGVPYALAGEENEPVFTMTVDVLSGSPVRKVGSDTHRIETQPIDGGVRVILPPRAEMAMNRDFILHYKLAGDSLNGGLMLDRFKGENYFLLTVQPPARVKPALIPPRDYLFVMDISGSMWGFPLDVSTTLLKELLISLRDTDTFNVLLFSGSSRTLFDKSVAATPENIAAALQLFEKGHNYDDYGGGTELLPALKRALALPTTGPAVSRSIIVITDGFVDVEAEAFALVKKNLSEANLFAFGIGSSVNRELIERLARAGRSEPVIVENQARAKVAAEKFKKMIEAPLLTHVLVTYAGETVNAPDVLAQRPLLICGKWPEGAPMDNQTICVSGETGEGPWSTQVRLGDAIKLGEQGILAHLWARERLWDLKDLHALNVDAKTQKAAIIELGLKYNLLTPFTSFVAVDMTPRLTTDAAEQAKKVTQAQPLPQGVSELAIGTDDTDDVPTSPEPETISLMIVAALVAALAFWRKHGAKLQKATS